MTNSKYKELHVVDICIEYGDAVSTYDEEETAKQIVNLLAERKHSICSAVKVLNLCKSAIQFSAVGSSRSVIALND